MNRRTLIQATLGGGLLAWAGSTVWSHAQTSKRPRLAVIMLQGGADGLSLAPPLSDGRYLELRGPLAITAPLPFTAGFGLHPALVETAAMARRGEVRLAPAAASPSCTRSHSAETEALLSGLSDGRGPMSGWLNRAVALVSPNTVLPAISLDTVASKAVEGPALFGAWSPGAPAIASDYADRLRALYAGDPRLTRLLQTTERMQSKAGQAASDLTGSALAIRAGVIGRLFAEDDGPTAAFLSAGGFDTHQDQGADHGPLADRFAELDLALAALRKGAGDAWAKTAVIVVTEFGRTAAANGMHGTDHGLASAALVLGGALKPGGVIGEWPTLDSRALNAGRDLARGLDLRSLFKGVLAEHWGLKRADLDAMVFPGSAGAPGLSGLIA